MTLADLTDLAAATLAASSIEERAALGQALARGVLDRLSEEQPCGWEEPEISSALKYEGSRAIYFPPDWRNTTRFSADAADHMARMLLAAADSARAEESGDE